MHIYQIIIYCHGDCFVIFQFHYRDKQQELMDHKREIRCLNNDYSLYLATMQREEYNSSVTQHEKVNGSELEVDFTWKKHVSIPWVRNKVTTQEGKLWTVFVLGSSCCVPGWVPKKQMLNCKFGPHVTWSWGKEGQRQGAEQRRHLNSNVCLTEA